MPKYASDTNVETGRSKVELERTLVRYGADNWGYVTNGVAAQVAFTYQGKRYCIDVPLPDRNADEFQFTPARRTRRTTEQIETAWEQSCRQRWRVIVMAVKILMEIVDLGVCTFEQAFLSYLVLPDGRTAAQSLLPALEEAYRTGQMPNVFRLALGNGK